MSIVEPTPALQVTQLTGDHWLRRDWMTGAAHPIRLDDMTRRERARLLDALRRNATLMHRHELGLVNQLRNTGAIDRLEAAARIAELHDTTPGRWLERQPLIARLRELVEQQHEDAA